MQKGPSFSVTKALFVTMHTISTVVTFRKKSISHIKLSLLFLDPIASSLILNMSNTIVRISAVSVTKVDYYNNFFIFITV